MSSSTDDPLIGSRIREYEILEVLGKGGMGAVYRARHAYLEEDRAMKLIQAEAWSTGLFGKQKFSQSCAIRISFSCMNLEFWKTAPSLW